MNKLESLLEGNKKWAENIKRTDPRFFEKLMGIHRPEYLWIGCSDSRITPATSLGLLPGEMFVHRNVANLVIHTDMNCLSVIQFAVEVLRVSHIIICGHYGCGGIKAALQGTRLGLIDNWLRHIQDTMRKYESVLNDATNDDERFDILCKLNVIEQVINAGETTIVQDAWQSGQELTVHGWIYTIADGIYRDIGVTVDSFAALDQLKKERFPTNIPSAVGL